MHVAKLTIGETEEEYVDTAKQGGRNKGGKARADALAQVSAKQAAAARWKTEEYYGRTQPQSHS